MLGERKRETVIGGPDVVREQRSTVHGAILVPIFTPEIEW